MTLSFVTCQSLPVVSQGQRQTLALGAGDRINHKRIFDSLSGFHCIEVCEPTALSMPQSEILRIAFWNIERGKYLQASARLLHSLNADVIMLCELDIGMARSGQHHTARMLATDLDMGYVYGVEYLELDLGDQREQRWHAGEFNKMGWHGAALLAPQSLRRSALLRLECDGDWFDGARGERRIGGRMALLATVRTAQTEVIVVCVHLESHSNPTQRAQQMTALLAAIDDYHAGLPVIIGGDFNTKSVAYEEASDRQYLTHLLTQDSNRLRNPVPYEPLFERAREYGYDWQTANSSDVTQRTRPDGTPKPPFARLDWFFTRGLEASEPHTVAAVDSQQRAISDHELLVVSIKPSREPSRAS